MNKFCVTHTSLRHKERQTDRQTDCWRQASNLTSRTFAGHEGLNLQFQQEVEVRRWQVRGPAGLILSQIKQSNTTTTYQNQNKNNNKNQQKQTPAPNLCEPLCTLLCRCRSMSIGAGPWCLPLELYTGQVLGSQAPCLSLPPFLPTLLGVNYASFLHGLWGFKLRSPRFRGKCFIDWVISLVHKAMALNKSKAVAALDTFTTSLQEAESTPRPRKARYPPTVNNTSLYSQLSRLPGATSIIFGFLRAPQSPVKLPHLLPGLRKI